MTDFMSGVVIMFSIEGTEENVVVFMSEGWMNEAFMSEKVLGNKPCGKYFVEEKE